MLLENNKTGVDRHDPWDTPIPTHGPRPRSGEQRCDRNEHEPTPQHTAHETTAHETMTGGIEVPSPQECAPLRTSAHTGTQPLWWVLGAHGGSAASTLAAWWAPAGDAHRAWPAVPGESPYVVIAARATLGGLTAAHGLVRQYLTGLLPAQTALLGVVVTADRPGRVPAPIRLLADKLRALTDDRLWQLDYRNEVAAMLPDDLPAWNIGDAPVKRGDVRDTVPDDVAGVARDITSLIYSREYPPKAGG